jgi:hypothetical protein
MIDKIKKSKIVAHAKHLIFKSQIEHPKSDI